MLAVHDRNTLRKSTAAGMPVGEIARLPDCHRRRCRSRVLMATALLVVAASCASTDEPPLREPSRAESGASDVAQPTATPTTADGPAVPTGPLTDREQFKILGRLGQLKEVGYLAVFLASPAASYVTGQTWAVDGGVSIKHP